MRFAEVLSGSFPELVCRGFLEKLLCAVAGLGLLLFQGCVTLQRPSDAAAPVKPAAEQPSAQAGAASQARLPQTGEASWYGAQHAGKPTASGEIFDPAALTAAHRTLAFGSKIKVTNLANGKAVEVRINDRGPYAANRIIDLSHAAAKTLEVNQAGTVTVRLELSGSQ